MENNQNNKEQKIKKKNPSIIKKGFIWRPVPTIFSTTMCFLISGLVFLVVGAVLLYMTSQIQEYVIRYDSISDCIGALNNITNNTCMVDITLDSTFTPPVMVYYQLENFYQDHRRYIKSKSNNQLQGNDLKLSDISSDCDPITTMKDVGIYKSIGGFPLSPNDTANPCGLIAKSFFNDTYSLYQNTTKIFIDESNIAWDSDKKGRYKNSPNSSFVQWKDVEDEHFMVWMRPAGLPDFRKLWGRINTTLIPGNYRLKISSNFPVESFGGKKSFVLSTVNIFGGKNNFLGVAYLVVGCICLIMALLFWVGYKNINSEKKMN
jgi:hypothetical protein